MSLKALGLLCLCLSKDPASWTFSIRGLDAILKDGRTAIIHALDELEELGYLRRSRIQERNEDGSFGHTHYVFYDTPQTEEPEDDAVSQNVYTDNPHTENQPQDNIDLVKTEIDKPPISPKLKQKTAKPPMPQELMDRLALYCGDDSELYAALIGYAETRREKKNSIDTNRMLTLLLNRLDNFSDGDRKAKIEIIDNATAGKWSSFFPLKKDERAALRKAAPPSYEPEVSAWQ